MRQTLHRRLRELELVNARAREQQEGRNGERALRSALEKVNLFLQFRGIEPGPNESKAETVARALEISPAELHEMMAARIDPIHKYYVEKGYL